ncbi:MAG: serine hydrolase [Calditrichaeota bacterium]|nr:serine hydrolase [Calditrichota bacterium]
MLTIIALITLSFFTIQQTEIPDYYDRDSDFDEQLQEIVTDLELDGDFDVGEDGIEQISLAVIDLKPEKPVFAGVNPGNFIYPASVYKMYVAMTVLEQISSGRYFLDSLLSVQSPNDVDQSKEISTDPRPLLHDGDLVSVNYLLDFMVTRSDNSAANCLIDIADRPNINELMAKNNWQGSEVTRKFLSRKYEDPGYEKIRGTETSALHAADFMYKIETNQLINPWVSKQMKTFLGRQLDNTKLSQGFPENTMFYHKTGWFSYWTNDVGIVDDGKIRYVIACFLPLEEEMALPKFDELAERIHQLMGKRQGSD